MSISSYRDCNCPVDWICNPICFRCMNCLFHQILLSRSLLVIMNLFNGHLLNYGSVAGWQFHQQRSYLLIYFLSRVLVLFYNRRFFKLVGFFLLSWSDSILTSWIIHLCSIDDYLSLFVFVHADVFLTCLTVLPLWSVLWSSFDRSLVDSLKLLLDLFMFKLFPCYPVAILSTLHVSFRFLVDRAAFL